MRNYPGQKGLVVGLVKAFVGIGAGVFTQLYVGFINKPSASVASGLGFILYLSLTTLVVCTISSVWLRTFPTPPLGGLNKMLQTRLTMVYVVLIFLLVTVACVGVAQEWLSKTGARAAACAVLVILCLPLVTLCFDIFFRESDDIDDETVLDSDNETTELIHVNTPGSESADESNSDAERPNNGRNCLEKMYPLGRDVNLCGMLRTPESWILLFCFSVNIGSGIMVTTNVSQMATSLSLTPSTTSTAVTLISCGNGLGRLLAGLGSDILLGNFQIGSKLIPRPVCCGKQRTFPRPIWLAFALILNTIGHAVMALGAQVGHGGTQGVLFCLGCTLVGVGFGATFPLAVVITAELFGNKHVGANYVRIHIHAYIYIIYKNRESPSPRCLSLAVTTNQSSICSLATNHV